MSDLSGAWIDRARGGWNTIVLDIDSSVSSTHGEQEGSSYVAVSGRVFGQILARIARLCAPPVPA